MTLLSQQKFNFFRGYLALGLSGVIDTAESLLTLLRAVPTLETSKGSHLLDDISELNSTMDELYVLRVLRPKHKKLGFAKKNI
jgi:hypothetical protein